MLIMKKLEGDSDGDVHFGRFPLLELGGFR